MALSEVGVRKAKPAEKPYRMTNGDGLYVIVRPNGAKWWRFDYRVNNTRKTMSFGTYPDVPLLDARRKRDEARRLVAANLDPVEVARREQQERAESSENTFGRIADEISTGSGPWAAPRRPSSPMNGI